MLNRLAIGAVVLALWAPAGAAFAHDDGYGSFGDYWSHAQDHREHGDYHQDETYAHAQAHAEGFYSGQDHAAWHESAREAHRAFHDDHPDTWHDHYGWGRQYRRHDHRGYSGYGNYGYFNGY